MALRFLDAVRPVEVVQAREETVGVGRDAHHPLAHGLFDDGVSAPLAEAVFDLVVRQHGAKSGAPVDFAVCEVGDPEAHEHFLALGLVHALPVRGREGAVEVFPKMGKGQPLPPVDVTCGMYIEVPVFFEGLGQFGDGAGFLGLGIVPAFEQLPKNPLRPAVVGRIARANFARPVVAKPELLELAPVAVDVLLGGDGGVLPGLNGILLRGKTKTVVPHGVQDVVSFVSLVAGKDV